MTTFPGSPRLLKGAIIGTDPVQPGHDDALKGSAGHGLRGGGPAKVFCLTG